MRHGPAQGKENESGARIKRFMCMMDSMTTKELDSPNPKIWAEASRIMRIARGCGRHPLEVQELIGVAARPVNKQLLVVMSGSRSACHIGRLEVSRDAKDSVLV